ncbi:Aromatic-ring hydroxylase-like [Penicillium camemberti]|uniref:Aromatic-ring hydroxylase-like n=1 Tax=Penicillium camemberti (strain FM 013) TaxID=1429867 RepID=A0A0G4PQU0_PENC3|nr:Aromatic-ring hydroxylase-like [Penicillium camemberti]
MNGTEERTQHEEAEISTTHVPLNTSQSAISSHRKVIIIGAGKPSASSRSAFGIRKWLIISISLGSTGLALAHGLKKAGIPFAIFEKEEEPSRKRSWSIALHWGYEPLQYLVPADILAGLEQAQVDPHISITENGPLPMINGENGTLITELQSSKVYRLRRDKFRALLLQGLDVHWGKSLCDIIHSGAGEQVTAKFTDGTEVIGSLLIATDGPHSITRTLLVGEQAAKATPTDFASTICYTQHTREHALFLRAHPHHPLYQVGPHPEGYCAWLSLHNGDDIDHPENWTFAHYISFPEPRDHVNNRTMREHVAHQKELARRFVDPWRSVFEWMSPDQEVWYSKLRNWDPSLLEHRWDNRQGRVTLAGDAAHPMTFQRGQGLNHAMKDAYTACKAIESFWNRGDFTIEERAAAIQAYEEEMIMRTGEEVRLSEESTVKLHNWSSVMQSPLIKHGLGVKIK